MSAKQWLAGVGAAVVVGAGAVLWDGSAEKQTADAQPQTSQQHATATVDTTEGPAPTESAPPKASQAQPDETQRPDGMTEAQAQRERRRLELERAAEARFQEAVRMDGLKPSDVEPAVRSMFSSMSLQPVVDPEDGRTGYVDGMRIAELGSDNPLARAGFRSGDQLTSINGEPLTDPAQIAHLFTSLDQRFEVCAKRSSGRRCRIVSL